jgi:hypothetical protein
MQRKDWVQMKYVAGVRVRCTRLVGGREVRGLCGTGQTHVPCMGSTKLSMAASPNWGRAYRATTHLVRLPHFAFCDSDTKCGSGALAMTISLGIS